MTTELQTDIMNILSENYYSLGVESGHEALANILTEFWNNQFDENFSDWGITEWDFMVIVFSLAKKWSEDNPQTSEVLTSPQPRILCSGSIKENGSPARGFPQRGCRGRGRGCVC
jgi:hypothetical protein